MIFAIDPGTTESAFVMYDPETNTLDSFGKWANENLAEFLQSTDMSKHDCVIEMIASYGMPVGKEVFQTCVWIGIFSQLIGRDRVKYITRSEVKLNLCRSNRANDSTIRRAVLDSFPATGGGSCPQKGTKSNPGPLFGVSKDVFSALAVAITYNETVKRYG